MENKDMIMLGYAQYTFEDLEVEHQSQSDKANNSMLSPIVRMDALERLQVLGLITDVYMQLAEAGGDVEGVIFQDALFAVTGKYPQQFVAQATGGILQKANHGIDKSVDVAVDLLRTGANKFGQWLTKVSTK